MHAPMATYKRIIVDFWHHKIYLHEFKKMFHKIFTHNMNLTGYIFYVPKYLHACFVYICNMC
jgi:hypothetical protein